MIYFIIILISVIVAFSFIYNDLSLRSKIEKLENNYNDDFGILKDDISELKTDISELLERLEITDKRLLDVMYKNVKIHKGGNKYGKRNGC